MATILDVRAMAPKDRHSTIFETFRNLEPGGSFVLVNDHEPKPLLYQFQAEHDGEFDWWALEQGPQVWRVSIVKRAEKWHNRTVTDYLQTDHRRLDAIMEDFLRAIKEDRWDEASSGFSEFVLGLRRHIRVEEEILFPVFEEKTGMTDAGPTFVMKMEHKEINELLDRIISSTGKHDFNAASEATGILIGILTDHNMKEEHILYPESDAFITDLERAQIIKKAQAA